VSAALSISVVGDLNEVLIFEVGISVSVALAISVVDVLNEVRGYVGVSVCVLIVEVDAASASDLILVFASFSVEVLFLRNVVRMY